MNDDENNTQSVNDPDELGSEAMLRKTQKDLQSLRNILAHQSKQKNRVVKTFFELVIASSSFFVVILSLSYLIIIISENFIFDFIANLNLKEFLISAIKPLAIIISSLTGGIVGWLIYGYVQRHRKKKDEIQEKIIKEIRSSEQRLYYRVHRHINSFLNRI